MLHRAVPAHSPACVVDLRVPARVRGGRSGLETARGVVRVFSFPLTTGESLRLVGTPLFGSTCGSSRWLSPHRTIIAQTKCCSFSSCVRNITPKVPYAVLCLLTFSATCVAVAQFGMSWCQLLDKFLVSLLLSVGCLTSPLVVCFTALLLGVGRKALHPQVQRLHQR